MTNAKRDNRRRNWTFIVYPESAPEDWREILDGEHVEWVESPLHDKDLDSDGKIKKSHWHIALLFDGKKSYEQVKEIADKVNAPSPKYVQSASALVRYFAHMDNPEKAQYSPAEIKSHGGVDLKELLRPTSSKQLEVLSEIFDFIKKNNITEFFDFVMYCRSERYDDWFPLATQTHSYVINLAIKSNRHRREKKPAAGDISKIVEEA